MISQAELDAAYKAARTAIKEISPFYSSMISDETLQSVVAPAVRAAIDVLTKEARK